MRHTHGNRCCRGLLEYFPPNEGGGLALKMFVHSRLIRLENRYVAAPSDVAAVSLCWSPRV